MAARAAQIAMLSASAVRAAAWEAERNVLGGSVNWLFTAEDARIELKRLYPSIDG